MPDAEVGWAVPGLHYFGYDRACSVPGLGSHGLRLCWPECWWTHGEHWWVAQRGMRVFAYITHFSIQGTAKLFLWRNCACNTQSRGYGAMARPGDLTRDALEPVVRDMKRKPAELRITLASVRCWQTDPRPPKKGKQIQEHALYFRVSAGDRQWWHAVSGSWQVQVLVKLFYRYGQICDVL